MLVSAVALDFVQVSRNDVFARFDCGMRETWVRPGRVREGTDELFGPFLASEEVGFDLFDDRIFLFVGTFFREVRGIRVRGGRRGFILVFIGVRSNLGEDWVEWERHNAMQVTGKRV